MWPSSQSIVHPSWRLLLEKLTMICNRLYCVSPITPVHWIGLCTLARNQWLAELLQDSFVAFWLAQMLVWMWSGLALLRTWLLTRYRGWKRSSMLTKHHFSQFPPMNMPTSNRNTGSWEPVFSSSQVTSCSLWSGKYCWRKNVQT